MRYRDFGRTGIEISDIAPGLWDVGGWSGSVPIVRGLARMSFV